ncbi:PhdYeFM domain-containing protein [Actinosynnema sp. NPDC091369]
MKVIDQREFDRNPAQALEALEAGAALRITDRDGEVIELRPPADGRPWTTKELIELHKRLPHVDYAELRADIDDTSGVDRVDADPWERNRG